MSETKIGVVLQQHYNNPKSLGIDIFNTILNLNLKIIDYIIFDVRDIYGRLYIDVEDESHIFQKEFAPFFNQIMNLCAEMGVEMYFGIPVLQDMTYNEDNIVLSNGKTLEGRICPTSMFYCNELIHFMNGMKTKYGEDIKIFLPFFRYPPNSKGASCFCNRCLKYMRKIYGRNIEINDIISDFGIYTRWHSKKCQNLIRFMDRLKKNTGLYLALEVDLDPAKNYYMGILQNDCQDLSKLSKCIDECVVHFYDKSGYHKFMEDRKRNNYLISSYSFFEKLSYINLQYSLFFWNNGLDFEEYKDKLMFGRNINARTVFYLINKEQTVLINRLCDWR